jgi:hypothetical protein
VLVGALGVIFGAYAIIYPGSTAIVLLSLIAARANDFFGRALCAEPETGAVLFVVKCPYCEMNSEGSYVKVFVLCSWFVPRGLVYGSIFHAVV